MQARGGGSIINMSSVAWMRGAPAVMPGDIASLALFLASDESQHITRQCFQVDGGLG